MKHKISRVFFLILLGCFFVCSQLGLHQGQASNTKSGAKGAYYYFDANYKCRVDDGSRAWFHFYSNVYYCDCGLDPGCQFRISDQALRKMIEENFDCTFFSYGNYLGSDTRSSAEASRKSSLDSAKGLGQGIVEYDYDCGGQATNPRETSEPR